jgi:predicted RNA-binding protein with EMAP domain
MTDLTHKIPDNAHLKGFGIEQRSYIRLSDIKEKLQKLHDAEPKDDEWKKAFAEACRDLEQYSKNQDKKFMPDGVDRRQNPR